MYFKLILETLKLLILSCSYSLLIKGNCVQYGYIRMCCYFKIIAVLQPFSTCSNVIFQQIFQRISTNYFKNFRDSTSQKSSFLNAE